MFRCLIYLLSVRVRWGNEAIALADDGGMAATADGVHEPVSVVIIDHMHEPEPAPGHPLNQPLSKVVKHNCDLHYLVNGVGIICTKQHHLHHQSNILHVN